MLDLVNVNHPTPFFLEGPAGQLFSLYYPPLSGHLPKHVVVHVPAFAEEMNKSRDMVALQSRDLAAHDVAVLTIDLFGTGDSAGDFSKAQWDVWHGDIDAAYRWLQLQGVTSISLWGLRLGALLAIDFASKEAYEFRHLMLWQPVLNGEVYLMQFLRLRVAAAMFTTGKEKETTGGLKKRLKDGETLEIAGYGLNPELAEAIASIRADEIDFPRSARVSIFETVARYDSENSVATKKWASHLKQLGATPKVAAIMGDPFWATTEISLARGLLQKTSSCLSEE